MTTSSKPRTICFSSGKGGVGKTTLSVNLSAALAGNGKQVLLIDGDLGLANVDVVLGLNVRRTIQDTIDNGADPSTLLIEASPGFHILPAGSGVPELANLSADDEAFLSSTLTGLIPAFDYVVIDTAAGIGESVLWFNTWSDANIVVITPDPTSLTDAYALMKVLGARYRKKLFFLVVNHVKSRKEGLQVYNSLTMVVSKFLGIKTVFLGCVPKDNNVVNALRKRAPLAEAFPDCKASQAIKEIAAKLLSI